MELRQGSSRDVPAHHALGEDSVSQRSKHPDRTLSETHGRGFVCGEHQCPPHRESWPCARCTKRRVFAFRERWGRPGGIARP